MKDGDTYTTIRIDCRRRRRSSLVSEVCTIWLLYNLEPSLFQVQSHQTTWTAELLCWKWRHLFALLQWLWASLGGEDSWRRVKIFNLVYVCKCVVQMRACFLSAVAGNQRLSVNLVQPAVKHLTDCYQGVRSVSCWLLVMEARRALWQLQVWTAGIEPSTCCQVHSSQKWQKVTLNRAQRNTERGK